MQLLKADNGISYSMNSLPNVYRYEINELWIQYWILYFVGSKLQYHNKLLITSISISMGSIEFSYLAIEYFSTEFW
jgi:hypothetical protein